MNIRYRRTGPRISYVNRGGLQRIIAITQVARGGPGKDYAAKLHDCGAIRSARHLAWVAGRSVLQGG